jgi:hypothetical protein
MVLGLLIWRDRARSISVLYGPPLGIAVCGPGRDRHRNLRLGPHIERQVAKGIT